MAGPLGPLLYNLGFVARVLRGVGAFARRGQAAYRILIMQILFTFVEALGISTLLALGIGAGITVIGVPFLAQVSRERLIYPLLIAVILRELGPLLTAFIISARSATAIATEMAGMVISHEIEAYLAVGVDPIEYLAVPRFLGVIASMFLLNFYFAVAGLAGSFVVARLLTPLPAAVYFENLLASLDPASLALSALKSACFGAVIAVTAMIHGLAVERASTEVPVAGLKAVSAAFGWCTLTDIVLSALYYTLA